jgi:hypothetical protein
MAIRKIKINGVSYPSLVVACSALGVKTGTYYRRVRHGETDMQALGLSERPSKKYPGSKPYEIGRVTFPSFAQACRAHGLKRSCVEGRMSQGWTNEEAFGLIPRVRPALLRIEERDGTKGVLVIQGKIFILAPTPKGG